MTDQEETTPRSSWTGAFVTLIQKLIVILFLAIVFAAIGGALWVFGQALWVVVEALVFFFIAVGVLSA